MAIHIDGIIFSLQQHGGISVYTRELLSHLVAEGVSTVLTMEMPISQVVDYNLNTSLLVEQRASRSVERYRRCRTTETASVFHSSYYRQPSQQSIPSVVTVHDFTYERFNAGLRKWVHMSQKYAAIRSAQAIICVSEATRQDLEEFVGVRKEQQVYVIPNGVSETFRPLPSQELVSKPFVLYVGARDGYKNFSLMLHALNSLPDFELHCIGGGMLRPDELSMVPLPVRCRVRHLGFVSEETLNEHYNRAICLAYTSSYEGFGIPVIEAMRAGCPVVCIDCKAVLEIGRDALTVVQGADPLELSEAIQKTCDNTYRNKIIAKGLNVAKQYSWCDTHKRTLQLYKSLGEGL